MKIWFDADNAPHILVMKPIAEEIRKRGHDVIFTARDRSSTCELLDMFGLNYIKIGGVYGAGMLGKVSGTLVRAVKLAAAMRGSEVVLSFGHGSRALPIASRILGIPSITMYDYEWVNPYLFNRFCTKILLPDAIDDNRCKDAGISLSKVSKYPGYKENLYIGNIETDISVAAELGLEADKKKILLRPPAATAHYHFPEADTVLGEILKVLLARDDVQIIWIPRNEQQNSLIERGSKADVIVPSKVYSGPTLIDLCDLVIGGGGTMTREAAIMGIPSISFFCGKQGRVDSKLEKDGRLVLMRDAGSVEETLSAGLRTKRRDSCKSESTLNFISNLLLGEVL